MTSNFSREMSRVPTSMANEFHGPHPRRCPPKMNKQGPQNCIDMFWNKFHSNHPGKAYTILPNNFYAQRVAALARPGTFPGQNALESYEGAVSICKHKVQKIVRECRRINQKYRDPHFDIESDFRNSLKGAIPDCLTTLAEKNCKLRPQSVKRVEDIFENPQFFIEGATASDVRQGKGGDCWFMSALCTLSNKEELIQRVCVERDEQVGIYGFVFHRDGEWISEVIDDKLYLIKEDFDEATTERYQWLELQNRKFPEEEYRTAMQTGSRAIYFAQCSDQNETWLPLLEKAYAKAHGDYSAIEGGFTGEGIEDLTGGVTTEVFATDILDKEKFWKDELMNVNKQFLFGCGQMRGIYGQRKGIQEKHAYSIMEARDIDGHRLLKLRNPWGKTEWQGSWSDGSEEWTGEWMEKLNHRFGDDGVFWISYKDLLKNCQHFDRTRLFGPEWTVTSQWTSLHVPWSRNYLDTTFKISLPKSSSVVIVLSQLDDRYFQGLEGQYDFELQFRLHKSNDEDYIVRSNSPYYMRRSVSTELDLEAGEYTCLVKITASRYPQRPSPEDVVRSTCSVRREKLLSIGLSYDLAHAKGEFRELEREFRQMERKERREIEKMLQKRAFEARRNTLKKLKLKQLKKKKKIAEKSQRPATANETSGPEEMALQREEMNPIARGLGLSITKSEQSTDPTCILGNIRASISNIYPQKTAMKHQRASSSPPVANVRDDVNLADLSKSHKTFINQNAPAHRHSNSIQSPPLGRSRCSSLSPIPGCRPGIHVNNGTPVTCASSNASPNLPYSEISSDEFSWDSEIDAPISEPESDVEDAIMKICHRNRHRRAMPLWRSPDKDGEDDMLIRDPWNAVCVVGLRIYSRDCKDVGIKVQRGLHTVDAPERNTAVQSLDVDDSSADAAKSPIGGQNPPGYLQSLNDPVSIKNYGLSFG